LKIDFNVVHVFQFWTKTYNFQEICIPSKHGNKIELFIYNIKYLQCQNEEHVVNSNKIIQNLYNMSLIFSISVLFPNFSLLFHLRFSYIKLL